MNYFRATLVLGVFLVLGALAYNWADEKAYGFFRWPLWGDKAGYYVYLPFAFEYDFNAQNVSDSLSHEVGSSFIKKDDKLITKYPIGVAYFELPFYLIAKFNAPNSGIQSNPFYDYFTKIMVLAPPFYVSIGLFLLFLALRFMHFKWYLAASLTLFSILGTSLFYYTVIEGLMSHSFSFVLFASYLYTLLRVIKRGFSKRWLFVLALVVSLIVAVRPFNMVLMLIYTISILSLTKTSLREIMTLLFKLIPWIIPVAFIVLFPQALYYKYAFGSFLTDSYVNESFDFLNPNIGKMLFSANAGLFVYVPAFVLLFTGTIYRGLTNPKQYLFIAMALLLFTYLLASWHSWTFGCGFGIRPFVEWVPLLLLPLGQTLNNKKVAFIAFLVLAAFIVYYNITMSYKWTGCWFAEDESFSEYIKLFWL